jgi:hypothetical protein
MYGRFNDAASTSYYTASNDWAIDVLPWYLEGVEKTTKTSFRTAGVSTEVRTKHVPDTNPEHCRYISLRGQLQQSRMRWEGEHELYVDAVGLP